MLHHLAFQVNGPVPAQEAKTCINASALFRFKSAVKAVNIDVMQRVYSK